MIRAARDEDAAAMVAIEMAAGQIFATVGMDFVAEDAPYYERLGFRRLADEELTPGLRAIRAAEAEHGLDRWPRLGMRRELCPPVRRPNV